MLHSLLNLLHAVHSVFNLLRAVFFTFKNKENSDAGASGATRRALYLAMPVGEHMHSSGNEVWISLATPVGEHRHESGNAVSSQFLLFYLWLSF
jgi:hypothetical protein